MAEVTTSGTWFLAVVLIFIPLAAASVTWTSPPPAWTQTDTNEVRTVDMPVINGSTQVHLKWTYTITDGSTLAITTFSIDEGTNTFDPIGTLLQDKTSSVNAKNDFRTRFSISGTEVATLIINKVTEREEAVYQCSLVTTSDSGRYRIRVIVTVPVKLTNVSDDQTVHEGSNITLVCDANGRPTPNITWTKLLEDGSNSEVLHRGPTWNFPNIIRTASGTYHCTAYNGFGNLVSHKVKVNVIYPAKIVKLPSEYEVTAQESLSLHCQAEGNPQPTYTWTPCEPQQSICHESTLITPVVLNEVVYSCNVTNTLGSDTRNTSIVIASEVINITLVITSDRCTDGRYDVLLLWRKLKETMEKVFAGESGYQNAKLIGIRCGSVIIDLALKFSSTVRKSKVLSLLLDAAEKGMLGDFNFIH